MEVFKKSLKDNDIADRLSFPTKSLKKLAHKFEGRHAVLLVKDSDKRFWRFRCTVRNLNKLGHKNGKNYLKPVLSGDWHNFVVTKHLKCGDVIKMFEEIDQATGQLLHYRVEVNKKIKLLGVIIRQSIVL